MPSFSISVPHTLGQAAARRRVDQFLDDVRRREPSHVTDVTGHWTANRLEFAFVTMGLPIRGTLTVEESSVHVSGPLPLMAALFRGRIEQTIRDDLQKLLS
jgi:putative polyhydroxyalkanoic acid system protein